MLCQRRTRYKEYYSGSVFSQSQCCYCWYAMYSVQLNEGLCSMVVVVEDQACCVQVMFTVHFLSTVSDKYLGAS